MCSIATALGVTNQSIIHDSNMTASSQLSPNTQASYGRLKEELDGAQKQPTAPTTEFKSIWVKRFIFASCLSKER